MGRAGGHSRHRSGLFRQSTVNIGAELERPWSHVWVARQGGEEAEPRAFMLSWLVADELHILSIATLPPYRRQGLARTLLRIRHGVRPHPKGSCAFPGGASLERSRDSPLPRVRLLGCRNRSALLRDNFEDAIEMILDPRPCDRKRSVWPRRGTRSENATQGRAPAAAALAARFDGARATTCSRSTTRGADRRAPRAVRDGARRRRGATRRCSRGR